MTLVSDGFMSGTKTNDWGTSLVHPISRMAMDSKMRVFSMVTTPEQISPCHSSLVDLERKSRMAASPRGPIASRVAMSPKMNRRGSLIFDLPGTEDECAESEDGGHPDADEYAFLASAQEPQ